MTTVETIIKIAKKASTTDRNKWFVDELIEAIEENKFKVTTKEFDEFLNETSEEVCILGLSYSPASILKQVDPVAYRCAFVEYESSEKDEYLLSVETESECVTIGDCQCDLTIKLSNSQQGHGYLNTDDVKILITKLKSLFK